MAEHAGAMSAWDYAEDQTGHYTPLVLMVWRGDSPVQTVPILRRNGYVVFAVPAETFALNPDPPGPAQAVANAPLDLYDFSATALVRTLGGAALRADCQLVLLTEEGAANAEPFESDTETVQFHDDGWWPCPQDAVTAGEWHFSPQLVGAEDYHTGAEADDGEPYEEVRSAAGSTAWWHAAAPGEATPTTAAAGAASPLPLPSQAPPRARGRGGRRARGGGRARGAAYLEEPAAIPLGAAAQPSLAQGSPAYVPLPPPNGCATPFRPPQAGAGAPPPPLQAPYPGLDPASVAHALAAGVQPSDLAAFSELLGRGTALGAQRPSGSGRAVS